MFDSKVNLKSGLGCSLIHILEGKDVQVDCADVTVSMKKYIILSKKYVMCHFFSLPYFKIDKVEKILL